LGRPKGKRNQAMSLKHICDSVSDIIGVQVKFVDDCIGEKVKNSTAFMNCLWWEFMRIYSPLCPMQPTF
ncbi:MAG: phosphoglycerate kinase, partial [Croceitalea sp.]|nr:phosphoglycerate kinase [Croceitalea sp.]